MAGPPSEAAGPTKRVSDLARRGPLLVAGIMSGTSLDGIDVALVLLDGEGPGMTCELRGSWSGGFSPGLVRELADCADADAYSVDAFCRLTPALNLEYAAAVRAATAAAGMDVSDLDLVGCHGQTLRHHPTPGRLGDALVGATLQLGGGPGLSALLGLPVVSDFRAADVALGGQGAPLVPYLDYVLLSHAGQNRIALNLGGIANITALPASCRREDVLAFDTGPANMVIDGLCRRLFNLPFDRDGARARAGRVDAGLLAWALDHPYFSRKPPKSAGRRTDGTAGFGKAYSERFLARGEGLAPEDLVATATQLTVETVAQSVRRFVPFQPDLVLVAGGGARNPVLMEGLASALGALAPTDEAGVDSHYKEAIAFALLAHQAVRRVPTSLPSVTGASRAAVLGTLSWA